MQVGPWQSGKGSVLGHAYPGVVNINSPVGWVNWDETAQYWTSRLVHPWTSIHVQ